MYVPKIKDLPCHTVIDEKKYNQNLHDFLTPIRGVLNLFGIGAGADMSPLTLYRFIISAVFYLSTVSLNTTIFVSPGFIDILYFYSLLLNYSSVLTNYIYLP
jgi:hypothetical protein